MNENFAVMYKHACIFQRNNCTKLYHKSAVVAGISKDVPRAHSFCAG